MDVFIFFKIFILTVFFINILKYTSFFNNINKIYNLSIKNIGLINRKKVSDYLKEKALKVTGIKILILSVKIIFSLLILLIIMLLLKIADNNLFISLISITGLFKLLLSALLYKILLRIYAKL
jgi:hypothetical protein